MDIFRILRLLGGLAMFLFGMSVMGEALEKRAGNRLKSILETLTTNTWKGFLLGLGVTIVIQSSSATTVMVVGFVNSGIMTLHQAVGVIMGANLGTSITSWLLSTAQLEGTTSFFLSLLKPSSFTPILGFIGILYYMFIGNGKKKDLGMIFLGFAVLMFGMETMSDAVEPLAESEAFKSVLVKFSNPILGLIVGAVFTAIIQSSSASVGILQALTVTGVVSYGVAIPIVMGQNIGTCVSAMISSIGATKNAKRAALVHLYFNLIAAVILMALFYGLHALLQFSFVSTAANQVGIAVVHTVFKLLALLLLLPFTKGLERLACLTVKDGEKEEQIPLLDERLLATPTVAIERCRDVTGSMAALSCDVFVKSINMLGRYNEKEAQSILEDEGRVDSYEDMLGTYLVKISSRSLTEEDSRGVTKLLHVIGDFERISDHAVNILETAQELFDKNIAFSPQAEAELAVMKRAVSEIVDKTYTAFTTDDLALALQVEPLEQTVDDLTASIKKRHVKRLQRKECTIELGFVLSDILTNLERVSDHCSNIALCMLEIAEDSLEMHDYQQRMREEDMGEYKRTYEAYQKKYQLPAGGG